MEKWRECSAKIVLRKRRRFSGDKEKEDTAKEGVVSIEEIIKALP